MPRRPVAPYQEVVPHLRTGDLIFCRGRMMSSRMIEFVTGGLWSHVAMVLEARHIYPQMGDEGLFLWESTSIEGQDIAPDKLETKTGPMLVRLEARVAQYLNSPNYRLLSARPLHVDWTDEMLEGLRTFVTDPDIRKARYPEEHSILWEYIRRRYLLASRDSGTFFCSELIANTYQAAGLLPGSPHFASYNPRDFSETGHLPRLHRSEHGPETHIGLVP